MPVYNKRGILLLPKVIVLNPKDGYIYSKAGLLVYRFVNNCTDHVGCGFECAGLKTQA